MPLSHSQVLEGFECDDTSEIMMRNQCQKRKMNIDICGERNMHELSESGDLKCELSGTFPKRKCLWSTKSSNHHNGNFRDQESSECLKDSLSTSVSSSVLFSSSCQSSTSSSSSSPVPLPRNMGSNNLALHFLSCIQHRKQENTPNFIKYSIVGSETDCPCDDVLMEEEKDLFQNVDGNKSFDGCNNNHLKDIHLTGLHRSLVEDNGSMDMYSSMDSDFVPDTTQYASSPIPVAAPQNTEMTCAFLSCSGLKPSPVSGRLHCHCSASWRGMYGIDNGYITDYY